MIPFDQHIHTDCSPDGHVAAAEICRAACEKGLTHIALTDHWETVDYETDDYERRSAASWEAMTAARAEYEGKLSVARGIEIGCPLFRTALADRQVDLHPYDFILASQHQLGNDPDFYFLDYSEMDIEATLTEYFDNVLAVARWNRFHSLSHLTYPFRYIPREKRPTDYRLWMDQIDAIFRVLIQNGKSLEINTSGLRKEIGLTQPDLPLIRRYRELGGELITIGSDAHRIGDIGADIARGEALAKEAGLRYVARYLAGQPELFPID